MDTIFALATPRGKSGVAIVRISGPDAFEAISHFGCTLPYERHASLITLIDKDSGCKIDTCLCIIFEENRSFTGEAVVELQIHGSLAIIDKVLKDLSNIENFRLAEPGEFTRRAMENGNIDLTQAEGLLDLISAETEAQRQQAQELFDGQLSDYVKLWRERLIYCLALLESTIDFADEDVPIDVTPEVSQILKVLLKEIDMELAGFAVAERVRDGFEVAIVGLPNVGKSTLLNHLAKREAAITSEHAGTTRDIIEVRMDVDGLPVTFLDTAGFRNTDDPVESRGIEVAAQRASRADLRIFLRDALGRIPQNLEVSKGDIVLNSKTDEGCYGISGKTGNGVPELLRRISNHFSNLTQKSGSIVKQRHHTAISNSRSFIANAVYMVNQGSDRYDLAAEDLRSAASELSFLLGGIDVEDVLDSVFLKFCIGK